MGRTKARYPTTPTLYKRGGNIWHYRFSFLGKQYSVFDKFYNVIEAKDVFTAIHNSKKVIESKSDNVLPINIKKVDA